MPKPTRLHRLFGAGYTRYLPCGTDCPCRGRARPDRVVPLDWRVRAMIERPVGTDHRIRKYQYVHACPECRADRWHKWHLYRPVDERG